MQVGYPTLTIMREEAMSSRRTSGGSWLLLNSLRTKLWNQKLKMSNKEMDWGSPGADLTSLPPQRQTHLRATLHPVRKAALGICHTSMRPTGYQKSIWKNRNAKKFLQ